MNKETGIIAAIVGVTIIAAIILIASSNGSNSGVSGTTTDIWRSDAPIKGDINAKVKVVEFSDFECPACKAMSPVLDDLLAKNKDMVLNYRYYPISSHKNGMNASIAGEIAFEAGKFWQMHDLLFTNQDNWANSDTPVDIFAKFAVLAGMDEQQFRQAYANPSKYKTIITADMSAADAAGLQGTPTFFINGHKYSGDLSEASLQAAITAQDK